MPFVAVSAPKCPTCSASVYQAEGVNSLGKVWHRGCLKCSTCAKVLHPGTLVDHDGEPYCKPCHSKQFGTKGYGAGGALVGEYSPAPSPQTSPAKPPPTTAPAPLISTRTPASESRSSPAPPTPPVNRDGCRRCGKTVYFAEQVLAAGSKWHKLCLRCADCSTSLNSHLTEKDGLPYCKKCYGNKFGMGAQGLMSRPGLY